MSFLHYRASPHASATAASFLLLLLSFLPLASAIRIRRDPPTPTADDSDENLISIPTSCYSEPMSFDEFIKTYRRSYKPGSAAYLFRKGLFELHTAAAQMQNCKINSKWTAGVNAHADWTEDELASLRGYIRPNRARMQSSAASKSGSRAAYLLQKTKGSRTKAFPEAVSWGHLASIQAARDQGQCGSCWAYAAETVMRAHSELYGSAQNYSVDELISCVPNPQECGGQGGCQGATIELAYEYVMRNGLSLDEGLPEDDGEPAIQASCPPQDTEGWNWPAREVFLEDGREVHMASMRGQEEIIRERDLAGSRRFSMFGWSKLPENREEPLLRALVEAGPLAVAVAAGWQWNLYKAGIMATEDSCQDQVITHAVVLFGYGSEDGTRFWHLKNSWGGWWGEEGNIRLQRLDQEEQVCDWDTKPEVGTGCLGGPPKVWVCGSCGILYDVSVPHFRSLAMGNREAWDELAMESE